MWTAVVSAIVCGGGAAENAIVAQAPTAAVTMSRTRAVFERRTRMNPPSRSFACPSHATSGRAAGKPRPRVNSMASWPTLTAEFPEFDRERRRIEGALHDGVQQD